MPKTTGHIDIDLVTCKGCSLCLAACPAGVIKLASQVNSKGYNYAYMNIPEACTGCANCAMVCPDSCITVYRYQRAMAH